jgi:hypothetical protein
VAWGQHIPIVAEGVHSEREGTSETKQRQKGAVGGAMLLEELVT